MVKENKIGYFFIVLASVIIVLAGIKSASTLLVPFLLSLFIAIILSPAYNFFQKKGLPSGIALVLVMVIFLLFLGFIGKLIGTSITDFSANIDMYAQKLAVSYMSMVQYAEKFGIALPVEEFSNLISAKRAMTFGTTLLQGLSSMLTNGFVILLTVVFMLLESSNFTKKIDYADKERNTMFHIDAIAKKIQHYMVLKALISLLTGFIIWIALVFIGTDYAFLWGVLAFMFNFIPNIGSIIAAVPAVLITFVQFGSLSAFIVAMIYTAVNIIIGSVVDPKVMGKGLGLSTLVVFLSLLFWGWLLGIVGMLLSIPLTIMAKIIFDANENTKWISILLGTQEGIEEKSQKINSKHM